MPDEDEDLDALPFVKHGGSISADMRLGWRPKGDNVFVAPIPLYYDFGDVSHENGEGDGCALIYLGPRYNNSIKVHHAFASKSLEDGNIK